MPPLRSGSGIAARDKRVKRSLDGVVSPLLNNAEPIEIALYFLPLLRMIRDMNNIRIATLTTTIISSLR